MEKPVGGLTRLISREGLIAKVGFQEDRVVLTPSLGSNPNRLNNKIDNEKVFQKLTASVPNLYHPKILDENPRLGRYEIEKAKGFNLTSMKGQVQGGGMVDFFRLPVRFKIDAMLTYLRAIDSINKAGYCFVDHKTDSVFIDPNKRLVSIVDADGITKQKEKIWDRELQGGLGEVLSAFFTRGHESKDSSTLIPAGCYVLIKNLEKYKSAQEVITAIEGWKHGEKTIEYGGIGFDPKSHFDLLKQGIKSPKFKEKIDNTDFSNITDYKQDILEAETYTVQFLESAEPQNIDKYVLGIN